MNQIKDIVWKKATKIAGKSIYIERMDPCGNIILYSEFGNTNSIYGWEIDHIIPKNKGGSNELTNLQPLQWSINRQWKDKVCISKPGMTSVKLSEYYLDLEEQKQNDILFDSKKRVIQPMKTSTKNWFKRLNDNKMTEDFTQRKRRRIL